MQNVCLGLGVHQENWKSSNTSAGTDLKVDLKLQSSWLV